MSTADCKEHGHTNCTHLIHRVRELEATLQELQRMPELPWAQVTASLMQRFARLSRDGDPREATLLVDVLDRGKTYVNRLEASRERLKAMLRTLEFVSPGDRCPVCAGWNMSENGETSKVHTKTCALSKLLEAK